MSKSTINTFLALLQELPENLRDAVMAMIRCHATARTYAEAAQKDFADKPLSKGVNTPVKITDNFFLCVLRTCQQYAGKAELNSKDCLHQLTRDIEGALIDMAAWAENVGYQESPEKFAALFADVATTTIAASGVEPECGGVRYPGVLMAEVMEDATEGILCGVVGENRKLMWGWR